MARFPKIHALLQRLEQTRLSYEDDRRCILANQQDALRHAFQQHLSALHRLAQAKVGVWQGTQAYEAAWAHAQASRRYLLAQAGHAKATLRQFAPLVPPLTCKAPGKRHRQPRRVPPKHPTRRIPYGTGPLPAASRVARQRRPRPAPKHTETSDEDPAPRRVRLPVRALCTPGLFHAG